LSTPRNNYVVNNTIGSYENGVDFGNQFFGVVLLSDNNVVGFNQIRNNGKNDREAGLRVDGGKQNQLVQNRIYSNGGPGIELVNNGNFSQASPAILTAACKVGVTGQAAPGATVDLFSDTQDEGQWFEASVTADALGQFSWTGEPVGPYVTGTARDANGNSSAFSSPYSIGTCPIDSYFPLITR
jgi:hypothetical protein